MSAPEIFHTKCGTQYLKQPGVALVASPSVNVGALQPFLEGFDPALKFTEYLDDDWEDLDPATALIKAAGQLCYMSFGPKRSMNKDADTYIQNLLESGHGSVLEHAVFVLVFWGIDRAVTHEGVRHRHHGFSQVSQRYVGGDVLRFVEAIEFQDDPELHACFERDIDRAAAAYEERVELLARKLPPPADLGPDEARKHRTETRKTVRQAARRVLPNETEAPIVISGNIRAWRNFIDQRASPHADRAIRSPAVMAWEILVKQAPLFFSDYAKITLPDGSAALAGKYKKV